MALNNSWILVCVSIFFWSLSILFTVLTYYSTKATQLKMDDAGTKISQATEAIAINIENNKDTIANAEMALLRLNALEDAICKDQPQLLPSFCP